MDNVVVISKTLYSFTLGQRHGISATRRRRQIFPWQLVVHRVKYIGVNPFPTYCSSVMFAGAPVTSSTGA
jgi:hypothetical protein